MAKNKDYRPEDIAFPDQVIVESELVKEMKDSYIDYAVSVIVGRAPARCAGRTQARAPADFILHV